MQPVTSEPVNLPVFIFFTLARERGESNNLESQVGGRCVWRQRVLKLFRARKEKFSLSENNGETNSSDSAELIDFTLAC